MPNTTKEVIVKALMDLLGEKPVEKIKVKDIVERCRVNRNTFYYHFQDIPDVVDFALHQELDRIITEKPEPVSVLDAMGEVLALMERNKKALLHIYHFMRRESFIRYMRGIAAYMIGQLEENAEVFSGMREPERKTVLFFCQCLIEGTILDWVDSDMSYDLRERIDSFSSLAGEGLSQLIRQFPRETA